jgi:long-chain fatty acid transport protein
MVANYVIFEENIAVNNLTAPDGELSLEDNDWAFQFNAGLLFEPTKNTRFGLTYLSEGEIDLNCPKEFSGLGPGLNAILLNRGLLYGELDLGMNMPQSVMFSAFHQATDKLALLADFGWQDWSQFGKVDVSLDLLDGKTLTADRNYDDTYHVAVGAQYRVAPPWLLSFGVAYDSSAVEDEDRTPDVPVGEAWRFGFGAQYQWTKAIEVGCAYELLWSGDMEMDVNRGPMAGRVAGTYEDTAIHFFNVTLNWKF